MDAKILTIVINLPFLKGVEITGKNISPAPENSSYSTEHLMFLGESKMKLTGEIRIMINSETGEVLLERSGPATYPEILLKTEEYKCFYVLPHRIQIVFSPTNKKKKTLKPRGTVSSK